MKLFWSIPEPCSSGFPEHNVQDQVPSKWQCWSWKVLWTSKCIMRVHMFPQIYDAWDQNKWRSDSVKEYFFFLTVIWLQICWILMFPKITLKLFNFQKTNRISCISGKFLQSENAELKGTLMLQRYKARAFYVALSRPTKMWENRVSAF